MNSLFSIFLEFMINLTESFLFFYLVCSFLPLKYSSMAKYIYPISSCIILCACNYLISSTIILRAVFTVCNTLLIFLFTHTSPLLCLFWGASHAYIALLSENTVFLLFHIIFGNKLEELLSPSFIRYLAAFFYLLIFFLFVFCIVHAKKYAFLLPKWMIAIYLSVVTLGICSSESLFNALSHLEEYDHFTGTSSVFFALTCSSLLLALLMLYGVIVYTGILYKRNLTLLEKRKEQELEAKKFQTLSETNQFLRTWKHENTNHLLACLQMIENKKYDDSIHYLSEMLHTIDTGSLNIATGNSVVDAILTVKLSAAEQQGISVQRNIFLPSEQKLPLDDVSLSSVLGNALDNAIEACFAVKDSGQTPWISISIKLLRETFFLEIQNSCTGNYRYSDSKDLLTTKEDSSHEHGLGLKRILLLVENADGYCKICPESNTFTLTVMIPL